MNEGPWKSDWDFAASMKSLDLAVEVLLTMQRFGETWKWFLAPVSKRRANPGDLTVKAQQTTIKGCMLDKKTGEYLNASRKPPPL